jgi:hypothetical protein
MNRERHGDVKGGNVQYNNTVFFVFDGTGTQGLVLARQALYHLSHTFILFALFFR